MNRHQITCFHFWVKRGYFSASGALVELLAIQTDKKHVFAAAGCLMMMKAAKRPTTAAEAAAEAAAEESFCFIAGGT